MIGRLGRDTRGKRRHRGVAGRAVAGRRVRRILRRRRPRHDRHANERLPGFVAGRAAARDSGVIHREHGVVRRVHVAQRARLRRRNVRGGLGRCRGWRHRSTTLVLRLVTSRTAAVLTRVVIGAVADPKPGDPIPAHAALVAAHAHHPGDRRMLDGRAAEIRECRGRVAAFASDRPGRDVLGRRPCRIDVGEGLAGGVTGRATRRDPRMAHRRQAVVARGRVANRARLRGREVVGGLRADPARERRGRGVAGPAIAGGRVRRILRRRRPGHDRHPVPALARFVAGRARGAGHRRVVHRRTGKRREVGRRMAGLARRRGRNVVRRLGLEVGHPGERLARVVAGRTAGGDPGVDHRRARTERRGRLVAASRNPPWSGCVPRPAASASLR